MDEFDQHPSDPHSSGGSSDQKFHDMQPISGPPTMQTFHGVGTTVYGRRDFDEETQSYVKTLWIVFVFLPVLALRAYRVIDAGGGGWYFLGRVPLSPAAKLWNWFIVLAVPAGIGIGIHLHHYHSAAAVAQRQLEEATRLADAGHLKEAAETCRSVLSTHSPSTKQALDTLSSVLDKPGPEEESAAAFQVAARIVKVHNGPAGVFERGIDKAEKLAPTHPAPAASILEAIVPLGPRDSPRLLDLRFSLLEKTVAAEPGNIDAISALAEVCETRRNVDRCEKLLMPASTKLGQREGARILGQILVSRGKFEEAYPLLEAYVEPRVKQLKEAEQRFQSTLKREDDIVIEDLQNRRAPDFDFARYQALPRPAQDQMIADYLDRRHKDNPRLKEALSQIRDEQRVVPVVLDLGIVLLRRGEALADPKARRAELEKAEKTFVSISRIAGRSDEFRLNLGQVYYWLGKEKEGKQLFDEALKASDRRAETVHSVAGILREVGSVSQARQLLEENYDKENNVKAKAQLASHRALMYFDLDDKIGWLEKADTDNPSTKANLASALGKKAEREGRDEDAARQYRESIAIYEGLPREASSYNNAAISYMDLYHVTGDQGAWIKSLALLEKALESKPRDAIILLNLAGGTLNKGVGAVVADQIDLSLLRATGHLGQLAFLYRDSAGRKAWAEKLRKNADVEKALTMFDRLQALAPKNLDIYGALAGLYMSTDDTKALATLIGRLQRAELDLADLQRRTVENYQGKNDAKRREEMRGLLPREEARLRDARKVGGATLAIAIDEMSRTRDSLRALGDPIDCQEGVALAREAHQAAPSQGTERLLLGALLASAHEKLTKSDADYKILAGKHARHVGPSFLLAIELSRNSDSAKAVLDVPEIKEALDLIREIAERSLKDASSWHWAMLRHQASETAEKIATESVKNELARHARKFKEKLNSLQVADVCQSVWELQMAGKDKEANELIERAAAQGVPLPVAEMKAN